MKPERSLLVQVAVVQQGAAETVVSIVGAHRGLEVAAHTLPHAVHQVSSGLRGLGDWTLESTLLKYTYPQGGFGQSWLQSALGHMGSRPCHHVRLGLSVRAIPRWG